jgi:hypothetical protein
MASDFNDSESAAPECPRRIMHMTGLRSMITIIMDSTHARAMESIAPGRTVITVVMSGTDEG